MTVGDYTQRRDHLNRRAGAPIAPRTKAHILTASRAFFRDCQEWEWIGRHFDPIQLVTQIETHGTAGAHRFAVTTTRGRIDAHRVVNAAGAWADTVAGLAGVPALGL